VDTGSREENASKQQSRASNADSIRTDQALAQSLRSRTGDGGLSAATLETFSSARIGPGNGAFSDTPADHELERLIASAAERGRWDRDLAPKRLKLL
jgi:hypothetical protein